MNRRGEHCGDCPHQKETIGFASTRGTLRHGVLIVLEGLGSEEVLQARPAVGPTGHLLNRMIERLRDPLTGKLFKSDDFMVSNTVWCRPFEFTPAGIKNRAPSWEEWTWCMDRYLLPLIEELQPKAILAAGAVPMEALTEEKGLGRLRGYPLKGVYPQLAGIPVVSTYHPAYLMKGKLNLVRVWQMDLMKALVLAREGALPSVKRVYLEDPPVREFNLWVDEALEYCQAETLEGRAPRVSFDIETPNVGALKDEVIDPEELRVEDDSSYIIFRISFAVREHHAVSIPWNPGYLPGITRMLENSFDKVVYNRYFDVPRVEFNGVKVPGRIYDGMDAWHFTEPGFPMGLKYASTFVCPDMHAWHLDKWSHPAWYNAADSDTALRVVSWCEARLRREGRWDTFERHFVDLGVRLQKISLRGIPTDPARRAEKREYFQKFFDDEILEVQPLVGDEIKPLKKPPYKKSRAQLEKLDLWVEGRMVAVPGIKRRETREEIPPQLRCDKPECANRQEFGDSKGRIRCKSHATKTMKEVPVDG